MRWRAVSNARTARRSGALARRNVAATLGVLERLGISTRDKFNHWVRANRWHDLKAAIISGLFLECGYLLGNEGYFDAPHSMQHAWPQLYKAVTETASGEGLWLGDAVGGCDAGTQVMGAWYQALAQRAAANRAPYAAAASASCSATNSCVSLWRGSRWIMGRASSCDSLTFTDALR
jgi:hypothetical protein